MAYQDTGGSGWAVMAIDETRRPALCAAVTTGSLKSVSLTSITSHDKQVPLELSLCAFPARPGSTVGWQTNDLQKAVAYKHNHERGEKTPIMEPVEATQAPAATRIERALAGIASEEDRALIQARIVDVVTSLQQEEAKSARLTGEIESLTVASKQDKAVLEAEVKRFMENTGAKYKAPYALESCAQSIVNSNDANEMRRAIDRVLTVANRAHAERVTAAPTERLSTGEAHGKRARQAEPKPAQAPVAAAPVASAVAPVDNRSPIQRAFANTFK